MIRETKQVAEAKQVIFVPLEQKDVKDTGAVRGYGSVFNNVDLGKDIVAPEAFKRTLAGHEKKGTLPSFFFNHKIDEPVGDWLKMGVDSKGLSNEGMYWIGKGIPKVEQAYMLAKGNSPKGFSIGYIPQKWDMDSKSGVRTLTEVDLLEVSIVSFPMNQKAVVTDVKSLLPRGEDGRIKSIRELEEFLREAGFSRTEAKAILAKGAIGLGLRDADDDAAFELIKASLNNLVIPNAG